jgi:hypothetical protein
MIDYMLVVANWTSTDSTAAADAVTAEAQARMPQTLKITGDPHGIDPQWHRARFAYTSIAYLFRRAGLSLIGAVQMASCVGYIALCVAMMLWLARSCTPWLTVAISGCVAVSRPFWEVLHLATPDGLYAALAVLALYLLIERGALVTGSLALIASVVARTDGAMLAVCVLGYLSFLAPTPVGMRWRLSVPVALVCAAIAVKFSPGAAYLSFWARHEGEPVSLGLYVRLLRKGLSVVPGSTLPLFVAVLLLQIYVATLLDSVKQRFHLSVAGVLLAAIAGRYMLFPWVEDRFFVAYYVAFIAIATRAARELIDARTTLHPSEEIRDQAVGVPGVQRATLRSSPSGD